MASIIYDLVNPVELTQYIRSWDLEVNRPQSKLMLEEILPNQFTEDLDFRIRKGALNDVDAAEYRAWDTPAPMTGRPGTTRIQGTLGPISRMIPLGEEETLRERSLDRQSNDPLVNAIYDDAERMARSVQARIELARGDLIDDGILTIQENGLTLTMDTGRDVDFSPTAGIVWSNTASAVPITNLLAWTETYFEEHGVMPERFRVTRQILGYMALNAEVRSYAAANGTTPNRVTFQTISDILAAEGLPAPWLYETKVRVDGAQVPVLDASKVYLLPGASEPLGNTMFGVTAEALVLREKGMITREEAPGLVVVALEQEHPVSTFTLATAVAMPIMPNPNLCMDCQVLA